MTAARECTCRPRKDDSAALAARECACASRARKEHGAALLMALIVTLFVSAVGGALMVLAATDRRIATAEESRDVARGLAEVLLERVFQDLLQAPDWSAVLSSGAGATFRDTGLPPAAVRAQVGDLAALTLNVQREADDFNRWGPDGPRWRLYAFGPADRLVARAASFRAESSFYVIAWVADDPGEGDGNPDADCNETIQVRADAFGPFGTRQAMLATVRRKSGMLQVVSWRTPGG
jgi:hypothetical protein